MLYLLRETTAPFLDDDIFGFRRHARQSKTAVILARNVVWRGSRGLLHHNQENIKQKNMAPHSLLNFKKLLCLCNYTSGSHMKYETYLIGNIFNNAFNQTKICTM